MKNQQHIELCMKNMMEANPDLIVFPERWWYHDFNDINPEAIENSYIQQKSIIINLSRKYSVPIVSGALWEYEKAKNIFQINSYYVNSIGEIIAKQPKIHLYGKERKYFHPGSELSVIYDERLNLKFAMLICFDLNISNSLAHQAVINGADLLLNPVLIWKEGVENWNIYLKARALENRVPIVASNSLVKYGDRIVPGLSKSISFHPGSPSPVLLREETLSSSQNWAVHLIDLEFPRKIRKIRLAENQNLSKISIKQITC